MKVKGIARLPVEGKKDHRAEIDLVELLHDPTNDLLRALRVLVTALTSDDKDWINVNCDYAAEKAKFFLDAQAMREE